MCQYLAFNFNYSDGMMYFGDLLHHGFTAYHYDLKPGQYHEFEYRGDWMLVGKHGSNGSYASPCYVDPDEADVVIRHQETDRKYVLDKFPLLKILENKVWSGGDREVKVEPTMLWVYALSLDLRDKIKFMLMCGRDYKKDIDYEIVKRYYTEDGRVMEVLEKAARGL